MFGRQPPPLPPPPATPIFRLPIDYLDPAETTLLESSTLADLEWLAPTTPESTPVSHTVFDAAAEDPLARAMVEPMSAKTTVNKNYLLETQILLRKWPAAAAAPAPEAEPLLDILADITNNPSFHETYYFIETEPLRKFNHSPAVLEATSVLNGIVPVFNLIMTILMFLIPIALILNAGQEVSFQNYIECMSGLNRSSLLSAFFSQIDTAAGILHVKNATILLGVLVWIVYTVYVNLTNMKRFFSRLAKLSDRLTTAKHFLQESSLRIKAVAAAVAALPKHRMFHAELVKRAAHIDSLLGEWSDVRENWPGYFGMGYYLRSYYLIYDNADFRQTYEYCLRFFGWAANMGNLASKLKQGVLGVVKFGGKSAPHFSGLVHPCFTDGVPNDAYLSHPMIITGPNASGKTTFLKSLMIAVIMTQQYGCGFYARARMPGPYVRLHSYLNIPDTSERDSLFEAECRRCKNILDVVGDDAAATGRHFCIFDELFSGTNPDDACSTACAFLDYLDTLPVDYVLTTHYIGICKTRPPESAYRTQVKIAENGELAFNYLLEQGVSDIKGAYHILKRMAFPAQVLQGFVSQKID